MAGLQHAHHASSSNASEPQPLLPLLLPAISSAESRARVHTWPFRSNAITSLNSSWVANSNGDAVRPPAHMAASSSRTAARGQS